MEMSHSTKTGIGLSKKGFEESLLKLDHRYEMHREFEKIFAVSTEMSNFRQVLQHMGPLNHSNSCVVEE